MHDTTTPLTKQELRDFGLLTGALFAGLFGVLFPWLFNSNYPLWAWIVMGIFSGLALIQPMALKPIYYGWMKMGSVLGWINTRIILAIVFYLFILPIGLLLRLLGKNPLHTQPIDSKSYRRPSHVRSPKHLERPF